MKKHLLLGGAILLILFATSCSNENDGDPSGANGGQPVSVKANIVDGKDLRVAYEDDGSTTMKATWSKNETFMMYQGTSKYGQKFINSDEDVNLFNGLQPIGSGTFYAIYGENFTNTGGNISINISSQKGTADENCITEFMVAESENLSSEFQFKHKLAVLKLTLTLPDDSMGVVKRVIVSGLHNYATYSLTEGYSYEDKYRLPIEARNDSIGFPIKSNQITAYVAVFPETVMEKTVTIKAETTNNALYYYTLSSSRTLEAGMVVPVTVSLKKVEHEYVDLGLSVKWATMNVGAVSPEDNGDYYAWGETETKSNYSWSSYMGMSSSDDCGTAKDPLKDYVDNTKSIAGTEYDVVYAKWNGMWRMPTKEQMQELKDSCDWQWDASSKGYIVKSKKNSDNFIFLPASSKLSEYSLVDQSAGIIGYYWTSTPYRRKYEVNYIDLNKDECKIKRSYRCDGLSVRPVYVPNNMDGKDNPPSIINKGEWY